MHTQFHAASDCLEAQNMIQGIQEDPMTEYSGCAGEVINGWLAKHVKQCKACEEATILGNMP